LIKLKYYNR